MKITLLSILLVFLSLSGFGQLTGSIIEPNIPASPTASGLGKYGAYPISYYTGTVNVTIPLYEYQCSGYSLPVSLSYHPSGIKMHQLASWVGLGWTLNAGGSIVVNTRGLSDFHDSRFNIRTEGDFANKDIPSRYDASRIYSNSLDAEPDIFNYNFCGFTGQFVIDEDGSFHFLKNNNGISITCTKTYIINTEGTNYYEVAFEAVDQYGNVYKFQEEDAETTESRTYLCNYELFYQNGIINDDILYKDAAVHHSERDKGVESVLYTSWQLSEIVLANGKGSILFDYSDELVEYSTNLTGSIGTSLEQGKFKWIGGESVFEYSIIENNTKKLSKISCDKNDIQLCFINNHTRQDLNNTKALSRVEILNGTQQAYYWQFDYADYFISDFEIGNDQSGNPLHKRLKLNSIQKLSDNAPLAEKPYIFNYFGDSNTSLNLAPRNSFDGVDHWGYANKAITVNDANNAMHLFPATVGEMENMNFLCLGSAWVGTLVWRGNDNAYGSFNTWLGTPQPFGGGDRTPDDQYAISNNLKSVTFPTGGKTSFEYESNDYTHSFSLSHSGTNYGETGGLRVKRIVENDGTQDANEKSFVYHTGTVFGEPFYLLPVMSSTGVSAMSACGSAGSPPSECVGQRLHSNTVDIEYSVGGNSIGYTQVDEISANGISRYFYNSGYNQTYSLDYGYVLLQDDGMPVYENEFYARISGLPYMIYPFSFVNDCGGLSGEDYKKGLLLKVEMLNSNNQLLKREVFDYSFHQLDKVYGNKAFPIYPGQTNGNMLLSSYHHKTGRSFQSGKTITEFDTNGDTITNSIEYYEYDPDTELLLSKTVEKSTGEESTVEFMYPSSFLSLSAYSNEGNDKQTIAIKKMQDLHMLNYPVESYACVNSMLIEGQVIKYSCDGNRVVPEESISIETASPLEVDEINSDANKYRPGYIEYVDVDDEYNYIIDNHYSDIPAGRYTHDSEGNIIEVEKSTGDIASYIWGYGDQHVIASTNKASSSEIAYSGFESNDISQGDWIVGYGTIQEDGNTGNYCLEDQTGNYTYTSKTIPAGTYELSMYIKNKSGFTGGAVTIYGHSTEPFWPDTDKWNYSKRTFTLSQPEVVQLSITDNLLVDDICLHPVDAEMTTYTYDPLVGMTSQTDPNGRTTYYEYDTFGRLIQIKDSDGNLVQETNYNYANQ